MKIFYRDINKKTIIYFFIIFSLTFFLIYNNKVNFVFAADELIAGGKIASNLAGGAVAIVVGFIALLFNGAIGLLTTLLVSILVSVSKFQNIIAVPAVERGWTIVRDLCNMFFILILLVIAFATILRQENYSAKRLLPKLLIMAVLINFSKTIFGLIIDFAQVIMLTFVNGFAQYGMAKFITMFNVADVLSINKSWTESALSSWSTIVAIVLGMIASVITLIVIAVILAVLVVRVVMLWVYTILSPLVFLGFAFPPIQKYTGKIWEDFIKQVIVGPALAFFIWLALLTASESSKELGLSKIEDKDLGANAQSAQICAGASAFYCDTNFQAYIIAIALLMGGLMVTQQMGGAAASIAGKGMNWAKGASKLVGKSVAYLPSQYAKRAGYGAADLALERLKEAPIIGNLAMEAQAKLRMKREYAEEKDTRYMQYLSEPDLDRITDRQRARGPLSWLARGMESKRQLFKRATVEKTRRGEEWGMDKNTKMRNKTRTMIELAQLGGHSITASGEDSFRDADIGKLWHEFRLKNPGMIDDREMRAYYRGGVGPSGTDYEQGLRGADNSEYYRDARPEVRDNQGRIIQEAVGAGPGMPAYTFRRLQQEGSFRIHHENLAPWRDEQDNLHYDAWEALYNDGRTGTRAFAQDRARATIEKRNAHIPAIINRLDNEITGSAPITDIYHSYMAWQRVTGNTENQQNYQQNRRAYVNDLMTEGRLQELSTAPAQRPNIIPDPFRGRARPIMAESESREVSSGITGLDKIEKGRLALNFSEIGLDKTAARYLDGSDKEEVAGRIGGLLRNKGYANDLAKAVEEQIKKASYLILHNKEAGISGAERRGAVAHELLHARIGNTLNDGELRGVWNSMDEGSRETARQKVKKIYGNENMSEDAIMHEYFTEGLTNKTRWAEKNPDKKITLDNTAENNLDNLLKSKGSNIASFTSNLTSTKPLLTPLYTDEDKEEIITNSIIEVSDPQLQGAMKNLVGAIQNMGNGFDSIKNVASSLGDLKNATDKNRLVLENSAREYKYNANKLNKLSGEIA